MRGPDADDYKKLVRVMNYIQGTIGLPMILSIDKSGNRKWYVDAAFAVHKDTRRHTGGFMTVGTGGGGGCHTLVTIFLPFQCFFRFFCTNL